jgi:Cof subfamily protein (haloacid dehalogenase superfamily)
MSSAPMYQFPFKAVAMDLDGTLLNSNKKVTAHTIKVLKHLYDQGVDIILASGRAVHLIEDTANTMPEINCYIIGYNGSQCWSKKDSEGKRKLLFSHPLAPNELTGIFKFVNERNLMLNVYLDYEYAIDKPELRHFADHYAEMTGAMYKFVPSYESLLPCEPAKSIIVTEHEELCDSLFAIAKDMFPELELIKARCKGHQLEQFYVEFLKKGVDKGTALQKWCDATGTSVDMTIAFGDAENDIGLVKTAKLGVCMKGSPDPLLSVAKLVTEFTNDEDGVGRELQRIFNVVFAE